MQKFGVVNTDVLNLRSGPSTSSQIVSKLPHGTVLQIVADAGPEWVQVQVDSSTAQGYVSKSFVTLSDTKPGSTAPSAPSSPTSQPSTTNPSSQPTAPVTGDAPAIIGRAEVITDSLNIRSGPGTTFSVITAVPQGTVLNVLANQGDWIKVRIGMAEGYGIAKYLDLNTTKSPTSYLIEQPELLMAKLEAKRRIPDQPFNTPEALVARVWNAYGGLLDRLATMIECPLNGIVAVLSTESGGNCFGPDGKMIIRFENHIFWSRWGQSHADPFNQFFQFDQSAPANGWKNHKFRTDANSPWQSFHGNQALEYQVLTIARALDDTAALSSISMGAPQIMGFNFHRLGYDSVQSMFYQFSRSANAQLLALFDFVRGTSGNAPAIQALKSGDYLGFAKIYNGPANAPTYNDTIQKYSGIYDRLIALAK
jgi:uncharacterized protein YgiM (DUF1202 family)